VEILAGFALGFVERGRLDPAPFLAIRPWLLLFAAVTAARFGWPLRLTFYAAALLLSALSQALLLGWLGAPDPWTGAVRGLAAGALIALPLDLLVQTARRLGRRRAVATVAVVLAALLALPPVLGAYHRLAWHRAGGPPAPAKPRLLLMTALPIVWGEGGAFDPESRPAEAYRLLQDEFDVALLDSLDEPSLASGRLLLLAQPRWLAPAELVALDSWVRRGGRALILTDPTLAWPSELPVGDVRRPPPVGLLSPLLGHWGLSLAPPAAPEPLTANIGGRKLALHAPGMLHSSTLSCNIRHPFAADCRIGAGRALVLADADLLRDDLWLAPPRFGESPFSRTADNGLLVADILDDLAGIDRPRRLPPIAWLARGGPVREAVLATLAALLLLAAAALLLRRRAGR
jgi:hypothetical protein